MQRQGTRERGSKGAGINELGWVGVRIRAGGGLTTEDSGASGVSGASGASGVSGASGRRRRSCLPALTAKSAFRMGHPAPGGSPSPLRGCVSYRALSPGYVRRSARRPPPGANICAPSGSGGIRRSDFSLKRQNARLGWGTGHAAGFLRPSGARSLIGRSPRVALRSTRG